MHNGCFCEHNLPSAPHLPHHCLLSTHPYNYTESMILVTFKKSNLKFSMCSIRILCVFTSSYSMCIQTNLGPAEKGRYANGSLFLLFSAVNLKGLNSYSNQHYIVCIYVAVAIYEQTRHRMMVAIATHNTHLYIISPYSSMMVERIHSKYYFSTCMVTRYECTQSIH